MSEHELWNELGYLYYMSGAYNEAVDAYHRSIQLDGRFGRSYSNLALIYAKQGEYDKAVDLYKESITLLVDDKEKAAVWNRLGNVYVQLKNYEEAVLAYQVADKLEENRGENVTTSLPDSDHLNLSAVFDHLMQEVPQIISINENEQEVVMAFSLQSEQQESIEPVLQGAVELFSLDAVTVSKMAEEVTEYQQDVSVVSESTSAETWTDANVDWEIDQEADVYFPDLVDDSLTGWLPMPETETADDIDPQTGELNNLQEEFENQGENALQPQGAKDVEAAVYVTKGRKYEYNEQFPLQVELNLDAKPVSIFGFSKKQNEQEKNVQLVDEQGTLDEQSLEDREEEISDIKMEISKFKRVVQINPGNAAAWDALGTHYKSAGMYKDAIMAYQQAISTNPLKGIYHHHLALVYAANGRNEDAIMAFQKVIELDPDHSLAHAALGGYYRKMGLEELAQKHIGKAMKNIYNSESEYNQACLEAICGNSDQAIELLRIALEEKQTYVNWVMHDPDLDAIRELPRFKQLISDFIR